LPRRTTGGILCGLHDIGQRRRSTVRFLSGYES
jgi:hypothetical protein